MVWSVHSILGIIFNVVWALVFLHYLQFASQELEHIFDTDCLANYGSDLRWHPSTGPREGIASFSTCQPEKLRSLPGIQPHTLQSIIFTMVLSLCAIQSIILTVVWSIHAIQSIVFIVFWSLHILQSTAFTVVQGLQSIQCIIFTLGWALHTLQNIIMSMVWSLHFIQGVVFTMIWT